MTASSRSHEDDLQRIQDALERYYDADDFVSVPAMVLVGWADSARQGARFQPKDFLDQLPPPPPPVLPTTPGSVIYTTLRKSATPRSAVLVHTNNAGQWQATYTDGPRGLGMFVSDMVYDSDITEPWSFDAGAHDEGKTGA